MIYICARLLPGTLAVATTTILTRLLDPQHYGLYGLALVVMTFGSSIGFDWLHVSFLRFSQSSRGPLLIINTVVHLFLAIVGISATLLLVAWLLGMVSGPESAVYVAGLFLMWAYAGFELVAQFEIGAFRPLTYFAMNCGRAVGILVSATTAAWLTRNPAWTALGTALGMVIGSLFGRRVYAVRLGREAFDRGVARELLVFGLPLAAVYMVGSGVNAGTRALIGWLGSASSLGLYTAAFLLVQATLAVVAGAIASAGYALAVAAVESGDAVEARKQLLANGTLLLAVMAPASLGMALTAHGLATMLVAPAYVEVVSVLTPWMAASAFFAGIRSHFLDHAFQLGRCPNMLIWVGGLGALTSMLLTYLLLPRLGPEGAAIAVTIAMVISCFHSRLLGRFGYPVPLPISPAVRIAVACLIMAIVIELVGGPTSLHFLLQVVLGAISYAVVAFLLNVLDSRDHAVIWLRGRAVDVH